MQKVESVYITPRVLEYCNTRIPANQRQLYFIKVKEEYIKFNAMYKEWIKKHGAKKAFQLGIARIDEEQNSAFTPDMQPSCKMGCSHCCHYHVDSQDIEVQIIIDHCTTHEIPIDKQYLQEQAKWKGIDIFDHPTHSACVFLKDNKCSIYEVRPFACRNQYVFSDADICDAKKYKSPNNKVKRGFHFASEVNIAVMLDKDKSKSGWFVDILLKLLS